MDDTNDLPMDEMEEELEDEADDEGETDDMGDSE